MAAGHEMRITREGGRLVVKCTATGCQRSADFVDHPSNVEDAEAVKRLHERATRT
jgi:hypothetical protein